MCVVIFLKFLFSDNGNNQHGTEAAFGRLAQSYRIQDLLFIIGKISISLKIVDILRCFSKCFIDFDEFFFSKGFHKNAQQLESYQIKTMQKSMRVLDKMLFPSFSFKTRFNFQNEALTAQKILYTLNHLYSFHRKLLFWHVKVHSFI